MTLAENISSPFISALGWALVHSLWQIGLIALLWRASIFLARKASSVLRYNLSLLALLAIPAIFLFTFLRQYHIYSGASRVVSVEYEGYAWPVTAGGSGFYLLDKSPPPFLEQVEAYLPWIFWIYLAGVVLFSFHAMLSYSRFRAMQFRHASALPLEWKKRYHRLVKQTGIKKFPRIFRTPKTDVPMVIGFFKPVILLPLAMLTALSPEQVESILLHELYHIRRKDHFVNFLQNILEILFFYHPAAWWISRQLRNEREICVDEWVVTQTNQPMAYVRALVSLEEKRSATLQPVVAATQSKNLLLNRIKNIMTMKTKKFNPSQKLAAFTVILAALFSVAWLNPAATVNHFAEERQESLSPYPGFPNPELLTFAPRQEPLPPPSYGAPEPQPVPEADEEKPPSIIYLEDGKSVSWEALSEEDREKLSEAMAEMRLAMQEMNREMIEKFNSEEFKQQMQRTREEVKAAMAEMSNELEKFRSEEFQQEMKAAGEEVRKAMEELDKEIIQQFRSEEFRQEMKKAGEEIRKAMEELDREVFEKLRSEEFQQEMKAIGEEVRKAMEETGKTMEIIGPAIQEMLKEIREGMEELKMETPEEE